MRSPATRLVQALALCLCLLLCACTGSALAPDPQAADKAPVVASDQALLSIYLSASGTFTRSASFTIEEIAVLAGTYWLELETAPAMVDLDRPQQLLGAVPLPPGSYSQVRLRLGGLGGDPTGTQEVILSLDKPLALGEGDRSCLFLQWQLPETPGGGPPVAPLFSARGQTLPLEGDLVYIVCDDIDALYLVRSDRNFVVASLGLPGPLGEVRSAPQSHRLYLLSTGARTLYVFDTGTTKLVDQIPLHMTVAPRHLALSPDGRYAYVTDAPSNQVVRIDLQAGLPAGQASIGYQPQEVLYLDTAPPRLAVSDPSAQKVYLLAADTLALQQTLQTGLDPRGTLLVDGRLYVAEAGSSTVTAYGLESGLGAGRITVGAGPTRLLADDASKIYVSNYADGTLALIRPGQSVAFRTIPIGPTPFDMALSRQRQQLYVGNREARSLTVMDLSATKVLAVISLAGTPFSVNVLD